MSIVAPIPDASNSGPALRTPLARTWFIVAEIDTIIEDDFPPPGRAPCLLRQQTTTTGNPLAGLAAPASTPAPKHRTWSSAGAYATFQSPAGHSDPVHDVRPRFPSIEAFAGIARLFLSGTAAPCDRRPPAYPTATARRPVVHSSASQTRNSMRPSQPAECERHSSIPNFTWLRERCRAPRAGERTRSRVQLDTWVRLSSTSHVIPFAMCAGSSDTDRRRCDCAKRSRHACIVRRTLDLR